MTKKKNSGMAEDLKTLIDRLPPEMEPQIREHIEELLRREKSGRRRRLRLDWAGGLKEYRARDAASPAASVK
jgi:hypothetical protein